MNFFEHQEAARKQTGRLVLLFIAAVVSIVMLLYGASFLILDSQFEDAGSYALPLFGIVAIGVCVIVGGGSLYKTAQLSSGGVAVAEMLGGAPIQRETSDPDEKRLINVVEEMAIASGTPMPAVYLMAEEQGINAFAAGHTIDDAVIGVTRGTIQHLTRDELQGVIAHEFSHIFNGDMRLNIRLMGVLHGILLIGLVGGALLRGMFWSGGMHSRSRRRGKDGGGDLTQVIMLSGLALTVIGYVGTFFGGLIKSAISRQREYLADASAVQFTRNPDGIGGALKKIGALSEGSLMLNPRAAEASHLFFGQGIKSALGGLTATHPPLADRISRIDPHFDGDFSSASAKRAQPKKAPKKERNPEDAQRLIAALAFIGAPSPQHVAYAREIVDGIPERLREAIRTPWGARAVVFSLLLDSDAQVRAQQFALIAEHSEADLAEETHTLAKHLDQLAPEARLPLIDLAMPSLRALSPAQYQRFAKDLEHLIRADRKLDLFEWILTRIIKRHVGAAFEPKKATKVRFRSVSDVQVPIATLLSALAHEGASEKSAIQTAYLAGAKALGLEQSGPERAAFLGLEALDDALGVLRKAAPTLKENLLAACAATIAADQHVTRTESELFRAIADTLECPVPPLLAGQPLAAVS